MLLLELLLVLLLSSSWLLIFHKKFIWSLLYTHKANPYGIYVELGEALSTHFWFLLKGGVHICWKTATTSRLIADEEEKHRRVTLENQVKGQFLSQWLEDKEEQSHFIGKHNYADIHNHKDASSGGEVAAAVCQQDDNEEVHPSSSEKRRKMRGRNNESIIIAHSCRSIFYYIIKAMLDDNEDESSGAETNTVEKEGEPNDDINKGTDTTMSSSKNGQKGAQPEIKIATHALHFGSFHRLLRAIEKSPKNSCKITFYEIDMKRKDWTMDENLIDEDELKKCNLILCQNFFGVPFGQTRLFELGRKYNIPILEDCVQSGSLYGKYKGDPRSDIVIYSGGLDKTPACFGAGFAYFKSSPHGQKLYKQCSAFHNSLVIDSWKGRFLSCINQTIHVEIAKNTLGSFYILCLVTYLWVSKKAGVAQYDAMTLKIRKNKSISPFQHTQAAFLRKPSSYQLESIFYGLSKKNYYREIARREIRGRDLLLSQIPHKYHSLLFPWLTPEIQRIHKDNMGISEFTWVVSPIGDRKDLSNFLSEHFVISLINTTWVYDDCTKAKIVKDINDNLINIPNINQMNDLQIKYVGQVLTNYCQSRVLMDSHP